MLELRFDSKSGLEFEYTVYCMNSLVVSCWLMNNYIVRSYRDVIVITKFAITKYAIRKASKAQSKVMY